MRTDPRDRPAPASEAPVASADGIAASAPADLITSQWRQLFSVQRLPLLALVFVAGVVSLGLEVSGPRLMAPYFGTTVLIWAAQIGFTLLYLSIGYWVGGRLADRYPSERVLCAITAVAAVAGGLIPFISRPILDWSVRAFLSVDIQQNATSGGGDALRIFVTSLLGILILFSVPTILLGMVSPFAVRLSVQQVGTTGTSAGSLYALSTIGSILGAFLPVLVLIPAWGVRQTIMSLAIVLLLASLWGLRPRQRIAAAVPAALLLIPLLLPQVFPLGPLKGAFVCSGQRDIGLCPGQRLVYEKESLYNYIQVIQDGDGTYNLVLNEGGAIHSIYNPNYILSPGHSWYSDYLLPAPYFNANFQPNQVKKLAVIGLAGGTIARQYDAFYHLDRIDGAEIDPEIIATSRRYFGLNEPNLHVYYGDGRTFMTATNETYDVLAVDAFQSLYMPFQLTTKEFYTSVKAHLSPQGVVTIKSGHCRDNYRLVNALVNTLYEAGFSSVYTLDMADPIDVDIIATVSPTSIATLSASLAKESPDSLVGTMAPYMLAVVKAAPHVAGGQFFTDDRAPVEQLTDSTILSCV